MSMPSRRRSQPAPKELEVVTHWPTVLLVAGLTLVFLVGPLAAAMLFSQPAATPVKATPSAKATPHGEDNSFVPWILPQKMPPVEVAKSKELAPVAEEPALPPLEPPAIIGPLVEARPFEPKVEQALPDNAAVPKSKYVAREISGNFLNSVPRADTNQLRKNLAESIPELNWTDDKEWTQAVKKCSAPASWEKLNSAPTHAPVWLSELTQRPDLCGLPVRMGNDCQLDPVAAHYKSEVTRLLRSTLNRARTTSLSGSFADSAKEGAELEHVLTRYPGGESELALSMLMQVVPAESVNKRLQLVRTLADFFTGPPASASVARLAIFDLDAEVRIQAAETLRSRPSAEYREVVLSGFRYPWSPVADHAADAVTRIGDADLSLRLVDMLDLPDPCAPYLEANNRWVKREMVRVNHLRNCFLCHALSTSPNGDPLRGLVPTPGLPIREQYYQSQKGLFVRADITYLRQDFSVMLPVSQSGRWPAEQRHDFLVRTRELTQQEAKGLSANAPAASDSYPQREAVLTALRNLTGQDAGSKAEDWRRLLWQKQLAHTESVQQTSPGQRSGN